MTFDHKDQDGDALHVFSTRCLEGGRVLTVQAHDNRGPSAGVHLPPERALALWYAMGDWLRAVGELPPLPAEPADQKPKDVPAKVEVPADLPLRASLYRPLLVASLFGVGSSPTAVAFRAIDKATGHEVDIGLDAAQAERLRDWLSQWLAARPQGPASEREAVAMAISGWSPSVFADADPAIRSAQLAHADRAIAAVREWDAKQKGRP